MNSAAYINSITFDYVETWSFNRGLEHKQVEAAYEQVKLLENREERNIAFGALQQKYFIIINEDGQFHPFAKKINTFNNDNPYTDRIKQILRTEIEYEPKFLCAPEYRDALVFYDRNHKIVSTLNICFSCMYMHTLPHQDINVDYKTYDWLKKILLENGHDIENPEYSIIEDIERMKQRIKKK
jgi:hypothetical protein